MTGETAQQDTETAEAGQPDSEDPVHRLGDVFREQLDQAIEPVVDKIRKRAEVTGDEGADGARARLDAILDAHFSDSLQSVVRERLQHTIKSLVSTGRRLKGSDESSSIAPRQFAENIDALVTEMFSDAMREKTRQSGEQVVRELLAGDASAVKETGEEMLSALAGERLTALEKFLKDVFKTLIEAGQDAAKSSDQSAKDGEAPSSPKHAKEQELPGTLARSDKRAQQIWVKARDKAAGKGDGDTVAERAGYAALKEQYEKKGDRWVKKAGEQSHGENGSRARDKSGRSRTTRAKS
jgi:glutamyl-tRNA reductase